MWYTKSVTYAECCVKVNILYNDNPAVNISVTVPIAPFTCNSCNFSKVKIIAQNLEKLLRSIHSLSDPKGVLNYLDNINGIVILGRLQM